MRMTTLVRCLGLLTVLTVGGCKSLDITNPNEPDAVRALSDPAAIEALAGGAVRIWVNTYTGMSGGGPLMTQAQTYSASWNNFYMNFYSGVDNPTAPYASWNRNTRSWQNNPSASERSAVEWYWEGYYSSLGLANAVLNAIRNNGIVMETVSATRRAETVAQLVQGAALAGLAMNYDKAYVLDENSDLSALVYENRKVVRDAALAGLDRTITLATATAFTTPGAWANGPTYTNVQIAKIARTMAAHLLASWPRDATEAGAVDWARVVTYASNGMSTGTPFNYVFTGDGNAWFNENLTWCNSVDTCRVATRVANMLDPTQLHPYPAGGNPRPNSPDRRMGDGTFGTAAQVSGFGTVPRTASAGTDFAWSSQEIFNVARGSYHQSNIAHIRYDLTGTQASTGIYGGLGDAPVMSSAQNDLLWAEGLLRQAAPNAALAATLINNTRVTRGGLSAASAGDGVPLLLQRLSYELEIEVLGLGAASYYHRRRALGGFVPGTPREMPVPAKELGVFGQMLYTFGGAELPNSPTPP